MKALSSVMLALTIAALPIVGIPQAADKSLKALEGTVTYGPNPVPTTKLARNSSTQLGDNDYAQTAANSKATITLKDSSVVLMGSGSNVRMLSFNQINGTNTANFAVVGKVRFQVEHPAGAKANYTFTTPTGQIAVRGTVGDIFAQPGGGLQVNVYAISNPALPVQVTLVNGQVFTLAAGQSLVATAAAGAVTAAVTSVSQSMFAPFSELGAPANASSLGITATTTTTTAAGTGAATGAASGAATGAAAGTAAATTAAAAVGAAAAATVATSNSNKPTPSPSPTPTIAPTTTPTATPSPSPTPTSTSVPITISGHPAGVTPAVPPAQVTTPIPATVPGPILGAPRQGPPVRSPGPIARPSPPVK